MDLDSMTDAQLDEMLLQQQAGGAAPNFESMSDQELDAALMQKFSKPAPNFRVKQELPEALSWTDRAKVKNLSTSPEVSINYLKKQYPGHEVAEHQGEIYMRKSGEQDWRPIDLPAMASLTNPKELLQDLGDIVADVGTGVVSTTATAAGGLAGNLPGAIGAGMASNAMLETARQGLGKMAGLEQDFDPLQIGIAGAAGAVSPMLFGSGATAGQVATKAAQKGLTKEAAEALALGQKGYLSQGLGKIPGINKIPGLRDIQGTDAAYSKAASTLSSVPEETLNRMRGRLPQLEAMEKSGIDEVTEKAVSHVDDVFGKVHAEQGAKLANALEETGEVIRVDKVKGLFEKEIGKLQEAYQRTPEKYIKDQIDALVSTYDNFFSQFKPVKDPILNKTIQKDAILSAPDAFRLQKALKDQASFARNSNALGQPGSSSAVERLSKAAYGELNKEFDRATDGLVPQLKSQYKDEIMIQKALGRYFQDQDPNKSYNFLKNIGKKNQTINLETVSKMDERYGTNLLDAAADFQMFDTFGKSNAGKGKVAVQGAWNALRSPATYLGAIGGGLIGAQGGNDLLPTSTLGLAGAGLAGLAASPTALRKYAKNQFAGKAARQAALPLWNLLFDQDKMLKESK